MNSNICEKHFPEPIIYVSDRPLCKKCVPEYLERMKKKSKKEMSQYLLVLALQEFDQNFQNHRDILHNNTKVIKCEHRIDEKQMV